MPSAPLSRVDAHSARRRHSASRRTTPFNLKAAGRAPHPTLSDPLARPPVGWLGPWVELGRGLVSLGRLAPYAGPRGDLWVRLPAQQGWDTSSHTWLTRALRGLTGRVALKLRFKGKSFRWHRRRGALLLRFGHSHLVTCPPPKDARWRKHGKTKMIFFHSNLAVLRNFLISVVNWRQPNRYHSRGLRLSRQVITRKAGKVSAYR